MIDTKRLSLLALLLAPLLSGCVLLEFGLPLLLVGTQSQFTAASAVEAPIPPEASERYTDLPQSVTQEGFARLDGSSSLIVVEEYSSYACSHCGTFHERVYGSLLERVRSGEISFVYIPFYITGGIPNGERAALAAVCAGEQGRYWQYHDALFHWQRTFGQQAFSEARLEGGVRALDLNVAAWQQCMSSTQAQSVLAAALERGRLANIPGTPAIFVNGRPVSATAEAINAEIDRVFAQ